MERLNGRADREQVDVQADERPDERTHGQTRQAQERTDERPRERRLRDAPHRAARLWRNPGIRRLAAVCGIALLALLALTRLFVALETDRLKREWLARDESLMGALAAAHPELAPELPKLFAAGPPPDAAADAAAKGRQLAAQYGLGGGEADDSLLPIVAAFRAHAWRTAAWGGAAFLLLLSAVLLREYARPFRAIRRLSASLERAVKRNELMDYRLYGEGELGLLAHAVQELSLRLQETIAQLHKDKQFLKETIADISHQLKTPLASLTLYTELLEDPRTKPEEAREFLATCRRELERMEWLTLTLLKIARLEADAMKLHARELPLADTIEEATAPLRRIAEEKDVRLEIEAPPSLTCVHDPRWLAEAIANLVKNAIEHSPPGSAVLIKAEKTPVFVRLTVSDCGSGIDEKHLPHIFKKFYSASRGGSGVGLGLPLARSIVERHEGVLSAVRNEHGGTTFVAALPSRQLTEL